MIRVVLVDDHGLVRAGVRAELENPEVDTGIEVVAEAGDVAEAIDEVVRTKPDVVVCDVHLPGGNAPAVIRGVVDRGVTAKFLALSVSDAAEDVIDVIRTGARGYVTKTIDGPELVDAVRRVHEGDAVFSPRLAGFVLDAFSADLDAPADPELDQLTAREQEVMRLLARGYAYKEIARRLSISIKTVETHASSVLRKLQLSSRNELARWAADRRIM
ncbi:MAG: response regulator transcription factor [Acidimicrobiia bacterium]|nr:response regulator transcription factor [Acidimicrobiia bacterium]